MTRLASTVARVLGIMRLDRAALRIATRVIRLNPTSRAFNSLGWHLGHHIHPNRAVLRAGLRTGGSLSVNVREFAHRHIYLYGDYEPETAALIARLARPGWVFFDVGANVGFFSVIACDLGGPGASAVAFEPNARLVPLLRGATPACGSITVVPAAVGSRAGRETMSLSKDDRNSGLSTLLGDQGDTAGARQEVDIITLDNYVRSTGTTPNAMKIDVEGTELVALEGGRAVLEKPDLTAVVCEVSPERPVVDLIEYMAGFGFRPFRLHAGGVPTPLDESPGVENLCFLRQLV